MPRVLKKVKRYHRYDCPKCDTVFVSMEVSKYWCPFCRKPLARDPIAKKIRPAKARNLQSVAVGRARRGANKGWAEKVKLRDKAVKQLDKFAKQTFDDIEDDEPEEEEDLPWAPSPTYNIGMRLTAGAGRSCRVFFQQNALYLKTRSGMVAPSPGRGNQNGVMGIEAWRHVDPNGAPYSQNPKNSFEWCHLIADSLGGPTIPGNLVAASYGCNTEMNTIEHRIMGRTELLVGVVARCSREHVAEMIEYTISYNNKNPRFELTIDARNQNFTKEDHEDLIGEINDWLKQMGLKQR
jgi:hypothetical protein